MKRTEWNLRNEIAKFIIQRVNQKNINDNWSGHIGEVWINKIKLSDTEIISCFCYNTQFLCLSVRFGEIVKFEIKPIGIGLIPLRWLLKQLKR